MEALARRAILAGALAALPRPSFAANPDVAVIGAGVAGIAAARALMAAGKSVAMIEARDRIGGCVFTDSSTLGFPFDHGAQWLEEGPLVRELGARPVAGPQTQAIYLAGKELSKEDYERYAKAAKEITKKMAEVRKVAPGIDPLQVLRPTEQLEQLALAAFALQTPFDPQLGFADGLGTLVARWGAKVPVKLGTRVVRVDSTGREVVLITLAGEMRARALVVTVPVGVLAAGHLGFAPPLSAPKQAAIAALPMALYDKVAVAFTRRVIDVPNDTSVLTTTRAGLSVEMLVRPQGREAAIVYFSGEAARQLEAGGASAAGALALSTVAEIYGKEARAALLKSQATRWGQDPFARGAWSVAPPGQADKRLVLAQPHHDRIFFAGEATDPIAAGRVGGAYASGLRAAKEALAVLSRS